MHVALTPESKELLVGWYSGRGGTKLVSSHAMFLLLLGWVVVTYVMDSGNGCGAVPVTDWPGRPVICIG